MTTKLKKGDYCSIGFPLYVNDFNVSWLSLTTSLGKGTYPKSDAKVCPSVIAHDIKSTRSLAFVSSIEGFVLNSLNSSRYEKLAIG